MEAAAMSDYVELIDIKTRMGKILDNGVVVAEFKAEQCDKCSRWVTFDEFGYQKGFGNEKIIWFCWECR